VISKLNGFARQRGWAARTGATVGRWHIAERAALELSLCAPPL